MESNKYSSVFQNIFPRFSESWTLACFSVAHNWINLSQVCRAGQVLQATEASWEFGAVNIIPYAKECGSV